MTFVKIANIENFIEAQVLESVLKEREIPYRIRSFHDTAYDGLFQFQKGWGEIYAPTERKGGDPRDYREQSAMTSG